MLVELSCELVELSCELGELSCELGEYLSLIAGEESNEMLT